MTHHEIEEAVNQGRCSLLLTLDEARAAVTLYGPDGTAVSSADSPAECGDGLRSAYGMMFSDVEARYSQKLCRLSALWVEPNPDGIPVLPADAVDEAGRLTEAGVLLLDPVRNLRPGVPVSPPPEGIADVVTVVDPAAVPETGNIREDMDRERATGFDTLMAKYRAGELTETPDGEPAETPDKELVETPDVEPAETPDRELMETPDGERAETPDRELMETPDGES